MPQSFGSLVFTSAVKALQERYGSRRQYQRFEQRGDQQGGLTEQEAEFIAERDSFYIATLGSTGWPYVQHRGGPPGFVKMFDEQSIAFADYRGNKQYISAGNLATDQRVALIMVDYPNQARLKILGKAQILEGADADTVIERVRSPNYQAVIERVFIIRVEAFDWNCPQHITPRYTEQQLQVALAPTIARIEELERENSELRKRATRP
jgi:predicted pyridoxine 5'-phosphate oxidase superfamily flavin-nucleotide-binding protein